MKNHYLITLLVTSLLYFNYTEKSHAQERTANMHVYSEIAGTKELVAGNYSEAIQKMQLVRSANPMLLLNNLCVAYTLSHQFINARSHCTKAIKETYRNKNYGVTWLEQTRPHRIKRLYRERARTHLRILDSIENSTTTSALRSRK